MKNTGKSLRSAGKYGQEARKDRKSSTGVSGSPKKGGHGGKFTWSGDANFSPAELQGFDRVIVAADRAKVAIYNDDGDLDESTDNNVA